MKSNSRNHPLTWILSYMNTCILVLLAVPFLVLFGPFLRDSKSCKIESRNNHSPGTELYE